MKLKFWEKEEKIEPVEEAIKPFSNKGDKVSDKFIERTSGEGFETLGDMTYGATSLSSFNTFYKDYINRAYKDEREKIKRYREMADMPEVADVVEDAVNEAITEDDNGNIITLTIKNEEMEKNKNVVDTLTEEFTDLFYNKIKIKKIFDQMFYTYMVDGRVYFEKIIDSKKSKNGIIGLKVLPSETMDFTYDIRTGVSTAFYQYLTSRATKPKTFEEAENDPNIIAFYPEQIGFINYGVYGKNRNDIKGFLEKAKVPYNQLKLLETSVIIYRIVRAPERFVFRIDTGSMPKDKAMKFVNMIKTKMTKRQTYDTTSGRLSQDTNVMGILENFFLPQCLRMNTEIPLLDGRILELKDVIEEYNDGRKNYTYSVDQKTGRIIKGEIEWAGITRKNADLVRVYLDNDEHVDVTPDHKFLVWKDENKEEMIEVEAQYLTEDMDLVEDENLINSMKKDK